MLVPDHRTYNAHELFVDRGLKGANIRANFNVRHDESWMNHDYTNRGLRCHGTGSSGGCRRIVGLAESHLGPLPCHVARNMSPRVELLRRYLRWRALRHPARGERCERREEGGTRGREYYRRRVTRISGIAGEIATEHRGTLWDPGRARRTATL